MVISYICLPFVSHHGTQIFQCISDAIKYVFRFGGYKIINYVDDFHVVGTPRHIHNAFDCLHSVLNALGLSISEKKLVHTEMQAACLVVLNEYKKGTISVPEEKMAQIVQLVTSWEAKVHCSRCHCNHPSVNYYISINV